MVMRVGVVVLPQQRWAEAAARWQAVEHLGFDHTSLEPHLRRAFHIVRKRHIFFQVLYVLARQPV